MSFRLDIQPDAEAMLAAAGLTDRRRLLSRPTTDLVARHVWRCTEVAWIEGDRGPVTVYVKRWLRRPVLHALRDLLQFKAPHSAAILEQRAIDRMRAARLSVPRWLLLGVARCCGLPGSSVLIVEGLPDTEALETVIDRDWPDWDRGRRRRLIAFIADRVADLHRAGFRHRDLYTKHVMLRFKEGEPADVVLVDLTRVQGPRRITDAHRARDLATLNVSTARRIVSRTDRLRWLKRYLSAPRLDRRARRLIRRVARIEARLARRTALRKFQ